MADVNGITEVEALDDCRGIGRVVIHVVSALAWLGGRERFMGTNARIDDAELRAGLLYAQWSVEYISGRPYQKPALSDPQQASRHSEFVLACDMSFAARETAIFSQPEAGFGLIPGAEVSVRNVDAKGEDGIASRCVLRLRLG